MTVAEQAWIDNSLARLDELHTERQQAEAYGDADKLAEIDEEIASLTEVLETVADASGPINIPAANAPMPVIAMAPAQAPHMTAPYAPVASAPAPQYLQPPMGGTAPHVPVAAPAPVPHSPFGAPGVTAPQAPYGVTAPQQAFGGPGVTAPQTPFGGMPSGAPGMTAPHAAVGPQPFTPPAMDSMMMGSGDDLDEYRPSRLPLILVAAVVLIGGGVAGFMALSGDKESAAPVTAPQEAKVITATEVPEDTQEPVVAKGGDADRTPGTEINVAPDKSGTNRNPGSRNTSGKRPAPTTKKNERELKLGNSRDPLSGV